MLDENKDNIYKEPRASIEAFSFNDEVALAFDDMIRRSVPAYDFSQLLVGELASKLLSNECGTVYDIGCSTGKSLEIIVCNAPKSFSGTLIGIDSSDAMIKLSKKRLVNVANISLKIIRQNAEEISFSPGKLTILNYVLQFINPKVRPVILQRIHRSLKTRGVLLISEKICGKSNFEGELLTNIHEKWKENCDYSQLEIQQKKEALKGILIPLTEEQNVKLLKDAGFNNVIKTIQVGPFCTWVAVKEKSP